MPKRLQTRAANELGYWHVALDKDSRSGAVRFSLLLLGVIFVEIRDGFDAFKVIENAVVFVRTMDGITV